MVMRLNSENSKDFSHQMIASKIDTTLFREPAKFQRSLLVLAQSEPYAAARDFASIARGSAQGTLSDRLEATTALADCSQSNALPLGDTNHPASDATDAVGSGNPSWQKTPS